MTDLTSDVSAPPCVVLDTNIWLDILVFNDTRCASLTSYWQSQQLKVLISPKCEEELRWVMARPVFKSRIDDLDQQLQTALTQVLKIDEPVPLHLPKCRDASDQKFIELAVAAKAQALITKDRALLKLARKLKPICVLAPGPLLDDWLTRTRMD